MPLAAREASARGAVARGRTSMTDDKLNKPADAVSGAIASEGDSAGLQNTSAVKSLDGMERIALQDKVTEALRTCYDPEIPVNIYELGLIYETRVEPTAEVYVRMTL